MPDRPSSVTLLSSNCRIRIQVEVGCLEPAAEVSLRGCALKRLVKNADLQLRLMPDRILRGSISVGRQGDEPNA